MRPLLDRLLAWIAQLTLRGFFRSIEVAGRERVPHDRPLLVVANHYNAMVDAVLVVHVLNRVPRFLAKSTLWRSPLARPLLSIAGLVPVKRRQDASPDVDNTSAFEATHRALARKAVVAMFPEGMVSRAPMLEPLKTGAARIALGARAAGAQGLQIVPVGLVYEDRVALRSRALARVGEPIDLDAEIGRFAADGEPQDETNQSAVRRLTAKIQERLEEVVPNYRDEREAAVLGRAAEIALRPLRAVTPPPVPLARRELLAQQLARRTEHERTRLLDALSRYHLDLSLLGIRDEHLVAGYRPTSLLRLLVATAVRLAVLAPFALVGAAINFLPYWGVHWAGRVVRDPVMKATARLLAGVALFPLAWLAAVWLAPWRGWLPALAVFAASPALGLIAVRALERVVTVRQAWRGWMALAERSGTLQHVRADRRRLCALVGALSRHDPDGGADGQPATPAAQPTRRGRDA
jgi:glycerol-3-phosphate O-acyltransferase / dihydroxyacetone phosphate acyltransferase